MIAPVAVATDPGKPPAAGRRLRPQSGDRRHNRRYPIAVEVEYRAIGPDGLAFRGVGRSLNLSTSGILFEARQNLWPGMRIELTIAWPVRLDNAVDLNLCVAGRVARTDGFTHAVRIREHEFCVRGKYRMAGPRFRPAVPTLSMARGAW
jgi:hypothetical protein